MRAYVAWQNRLCDHAAIVRELLVESPLAHPSVMMRRALLERLGGYREFDGPEDYDLWLRAHRAGARFAKLRRRLLEWRDSPPAIVGVKPLLFPPIWARTEMRDHVKLCVLLEREDAR